MKNKILLKKSSTILNYLMFLLIIFTLAVAITSKSHAENFANHKNVTKNTPYEVLIDIDSSSLDENDNS